MKSVLKINDSVGEKEYPILMVADNQNGKIVVLFNGYGCGTVVYSERRGQPIGYFSSSWDVSSFFPFNGKLELSNN